MKYTMMPRMKRHVADILYIWRNWRRKKRKMKRRRHRKKDWDKHFYIQACSYIHASHNCDFTHRFFTAPTLLHTIAFTHNYCYTQTLLHTDAFTQTLLHRDSFTHKHFKRRRFYVQSLLHASTFTHKHLYAQTLYQNQPNPQKKRFDTQTSFRAKGLPQRM